MAKHKKTKKHSAINLNQIHPSMKYGVPLGNISLLSWVNFPFTLIIYLIGRAGWYADPSKIIQTSFLIALILSIVSLLYSLSQNLYGSFQKLTYFLIVIQSIITTLWMLFFAVRLLMADGNDSPKDFLSPRVWSILTPAIALVLISIVAFTFYHLFRVAFRLNKGKVVFYPLGMGAIFSLVMLGRHVSFQGQLDEHIAGLIFIIVGAGIIPGIAVGAIFCIIDLIRHPELKRYDN